MKEGQNDSRFKRGAAKIKQEVAKTYRNKHETKSWPDERELDMTLWSFHLENCSWYSCFSLINLTAFRGGYDFYCLIIKFLYDRERLNTHVDTRESSWQQVKDFHILLWRLTWIFPPRRRLVFTINLLVNRAWSCLVTLTALCNG